MKIHFQDHKLKFFQNIKHFLFRVFFRGKRVNVSNLEGSLTSLNDTVKKLHTRIFVLEKKLEHMDTKIQDASKLINKLSSLQLDLATDYNALISEFYGPSQSGMMSDNSKIIFSFTTDDDDDLIN